MHIENGSSIIEVLVAFALVATILCGVGERYHTLNKMLLNKVKDNVGQSMTCADQTHGIIRCEKKDQSIFYLIK